MIIEQEAYVEHYGVQGQKWGVRRAQQINAKRHAQGKRNLKPSQFVGNKATRGAAYVASYMAGSLAGNLIGGAVKPGNILVANLGATVGSIGGVVVANKVLKNVGNKRVTEILEANK